MSRFTRDDIKNELIVLFLGVLDKYRIYPGVNALNPLTKFFRYRTKDWFNRIVKDALFRVVDIEQISGTKDDSRDKFTLEGWLDILDPITVDFEEGLAQLDITWVRNPSQKMYQSLSTYERYLLFLTFNQDLGVAQIAEKLERDKDTIKRHLATILEKIGGLYKDGSK
jgi:DNA-directed RNA polymerase specialized sigma24 family protein